MSNSTVTVLLAAYKGERYIEAQLRSILDCTPPVVTLDIIVSDDSPGGSTARFVDALGLERVLCSTAINTGGRGYQSNFAALCDYALAETDSDYYCFADQDDIWHKDKLEKLLTLFDTDAGDTPQLVHSDLRVVDEELHVIAPSYIRFQGLPDAQSHRIPELLHQNIVTGCAAVFNRALLALAAPLPACAVVHDHWLALCAEYYGTVAFYDESLMDYRQHGANSIGATAFEAQQSYFKPHLYRILLTFPGHLSQAIEQAKALEQRRVQRKRAAPTDSESLVLQFASLKEAHLSKRIDAITAFFSGRRSLKERAYLFLVFALLPFLPARAARPEK